ncbi:MAG: hypothetical protein KAH11_10530 [Rhodospirillales bacterium]|nr:hypothetical protein [Rhodospirillales bacterium]
MCKIIADLGQSISLSASTKKETVPGRIFKSLDRTGALNFPRQATIEKVEDRGENSVWKMEIQAGSIEEIDRTNKLWSKTGDILHEFPPERAWPLSGDAAKIDLFKILIFWRVEHQWLWNRFWTHAAKIDDNIFAIYLDSVSDVTPPKLISSVGHTEKLGNIDFDPYALIDFDAPVNWSDFEDTKS